MSEKILYYAVNGNGLGVVFIDKPIRNEHFKCWEGAVYGYFSQIIYQMEADGCLTLPSLKWSDDPIILSLKIDICNLSEK